MLLWCIAGPWFVYNICRVVRVAALDACSAASSAPHCLSASSFTGGSPAGNNVSTATAAGSATTPTARPMMRKAFTTRRNDRESFTCGKGTPAGTGLPRKAQRGSHLHVRGGGASGKKGGRSGADEGPHRARWTGLVLWLPAPATAPVRCLPHKQLVPRAPLLHRFIPLHELPHALLRVLQAAPADEVGVVGPEVEGANSHPGQLAELRACEESRGREGGRARGEAGAKGRTVMRSPSSADAWYESFSLSRWMRADARVRVSKVGGDGGAEPHARKS